MMMRLAEDERAIAAHLRSVAAIPVQLYGSFLAVSLPALTAKANSAYKTLANLVRSARKYLKSGNDLTHLHYPRAF